MAKKVVVAMSGGVDSSVAAALLQEQGFEVSGMFMKNWSPEDIQSLSDCPWEQDQADAAAVCEKLGIPFRSVNFEKEYRERVVNYFLSEYEAGRTPNPDIMCNKEIKFAAFLGVAKEMGADYIATGHYAQIEHKQIPTLRRGLDASKDQSYFLYTLSKKQLSRALFPLGHLHKTEVRELAKKYDLPTALKKDSQGICFIGHLDLKRFLMERIEAKAGESLLLPAYQPGDSLQSRMQRAQKVGTHQGIMYYTIGERGGSVLDNGVYKKVTGNADVPPVFILEKELRSNRLYLTDSHQDPHFYCKTVALESWIMAGEEEMPFAESLERLGAVPLEGLTAQCRYGQKEKMAVTEINIKNGLTITVADGMWAVASGQSLLIYKGDQVIGGGIVSRVEEYAV